MAGRSYVVSMPKVEQIDYSVVYFIPTNEPTEVMLTVINETSTETIKINLEVCLTSM